MSVPEKSKQSFKLPMKVAEIMVGFSKPWFVAGGWAIDLFLSRVTREHKDVEIAIFRQDQLELRRHLTDWGFKKVEEGRLVSWLGSEWLELPAHEIHARNTHSDPNHLEVLLNECDGTHWIFRRNPLIKLTLTNAGMISKKGGIPFLIPEIVLLYKAKAPKSHDEADFQSVCRVLDSNRRSWLRQAIGACHPNHSWLESL